VVDSIKEIATSAETRIAEAKVNDNHFGFEFQERDFVVFSIETRKEQGEGYSTLKGFFKQYELYYVVGDERDLIRARTDFRKPREDVYL
jgi:hypothetical protein